MDAIITLCVLAGVATLFVTEKIPVAVSALMGTFVLAFCGILTPKEAFSGFSDPNVILFGGMFVVGAAMLDTGLAKVIGNFIVRKVGTKQGPLILALMVFTVVMSSIASNTGTVACLMPMVLGVCVSAKIPAAPILMSLAVAANTGCNLTMVGTPPNMFAVAAIADLGLKSFSFFEFSIIGLPIAICAVLFMYFIGRKLLPERPFDGGLIADDGGHSGTNRQRIIALFIMIFVILGLVIGIPGVPPAMVAITAAILCVVTGCITEKQAYKGIDWTTIFLFAGMLPIAKAMQTTGAGELIATTVVGFLGDTPSGYVLIFVLFLIANILTQFMPNTATAALLIPIGISIANQLNYTPHGIVMAVTIASSCSFATPIATPCNTLIYSPSGMHFKDYLKVGLPLCLISLVLCEIIIPIFWPF